MAGQATCHPLLRKHIESDDDEKQDPERVLQIMFEVSKYPDTQWSDEQTSPDPRHSTERLNGHNRYIEPKRLRNPDNGDTTEHSLHNLYRIASYRSTCRVTVSTATP